MAPQEVGVYTYYMDMAIDSNKKVAVLFDICIPIPLIGMHFLIVTDLQL